MSGTTQSLQRKIAGADDLQSVVRSMKALAASSIGQYERAVQALDDYYRTIELGLAASLRLAGPIPLTEKKKSSGELAIGAVVFGSDQGLVGRFNEVLLEYVTTTLDKLPGKTKKIWAVGERIHSLLSDNGATEPGLFPVPTSVNSIAPLIGQILIEIEAAREQGDVVEVYVFHNHPKSGAIYAPVSKQLLPLDHTWQSKLTKLPWPTKTLPEVIGDAKLELEALIRGYLFVLLFQACAESLASENASRLAAMQRAQKNIEDILATLSLKFHRIRQETIDEELFDVVSGFEALTGHGRSV